PIEPHTDSVRRVMRRSWGRLATVCVEGTLPHAHADLDLAAGVAAATRAALAVRTCRGGAHARCGGRCLRDSRPGYRERGALAGTASSGYDATGCATCSGRRPDAGQDLRAAWDAAPVASSRAGAVAGRAARQAGGAARKPV